MMQAGMFVTAEQFSANVRNGVFTHFTRQEDVTLTRGKLDEELARMSDADRLRRPDIAAVASRILRFDQRTRRIADRARHRAGDGRKRGQSASGNPSLRPRQSLHTCHNSGYLFLRAEHLSDGVRTYRLTPGDPKGTSYGEDCFRKIFGTDMQASGPRARSSRQVAQ